MVDKLTQQLSLNYFEQPLKYKLHDCLSIHDCDGYSLSTKSYVSLIEQQWAIFRNKISKHAREHSAIET
jgi:hypothetical protein